MRTSPDTDGMAEVDIWEHLKDKDLLDDSTITILLISPRI